MAKRFTDTNKYKKSFFRNLPAAYKLFWDFLYHECDNAGVWHVDFDVAQIYIGKDAPINEETALRLFNESDVRIKVLDNGRKWFVVPFVPFQYGPLVPNNNMHRSVIGALERLGVEGLVRGWSAPHEPLMSPSGGALDKDKSKDGVGVREGTGGKRFVPPTPQEAEAYARTLHFELDGEAFVANYEKVGWVDKHGNKIKDWKSCVVTWKKYRNQNQIQKQVDFA